MDTIFEYLSCPNCRDDLTHFNSSDSDKSIGDGLLICSACDSIFPITDGIPVLLKDSLRNPAFEIRLLEKCESKCPSDLRKKIRDQKEKLMKSEFTSSWEWEDVDYWDKHYEIGYKKLFNQDETFEGDLWPVRVYQRKKEMSILQKTNHFPEGLICEFGAGTAIYTRDVLDSNSNCFYIAADMSLYALKIRRRLLSRPRSLYILASIDNLPLKNECISAMLLIGILHHSKRKEKTLNDLKNHLVSNGIIYLDEVISRPSFLKHREIIKGIDVSLHEEAVDYSELIEILGRDGSIEYHVIFNTPFYRFCTLYLKSFMTAKMFCYKTVRAIDYIFMKLLGRFLPSFKAGEVSVIWRKTSTNKPVNN